MNKRQIAALETRKKLINAMKELMAEKQPDQITIDQITERAGTSKGNFYNHFKRREDLISEIAMEKYEEIKNHLSGSKLAVDQKVSEFLIRSAQIIEENSLLMAQNWMKSVCAPLNEETNGRHKMQFDYRTLLDYIRLGQENGEISRELDAEKTALVILDAYYGSVALWCISGGSIDLQKNIADLCKKLPALISVSLQKPDVIQDNG